MDGHKLVDEVGKDVFVWHAKQWKHTDEFHSHKKAQLVFVEEGYQYLHIEENHFLLPQNHVAWIPSNAIHKTTTSSEHVSLRTLYFDIDNLPPFYDELYLFAIPPVLKEMILYTEKWSMLKEENKSESLFLKAILHELPSFIDNAVPLQTPVPKSKNLIDIAAYIHQNYQHKINIEEVATMFHLSIRTLERQFKKETGISIAKYIQMVKIIKSIELLSEGVLTINEIAFKVGYSSAQSYSNVFTKLIGRRPSDFLNQIKGQAQKLGY
ncbi:AraC family transcriptional regulator [Myroides phaeus]|uniref:AraC family transcriptional regulator n=1 Tax=Myroides phaeus TaxID=702745 RepID=UPI0013032CD1|nr:AraC family transcriptional regulator [Myroides phaeus]